MTQVSYSSGETVSKQELNTWKSVFTTAKERWNEIGGSIKNTNVNIFLNDTAWNAATAAEKATSLRLMILLNLVLLMPVLVWFHTQREK